MKENQNMELVLIKDLGYLHPTEKSNYKKRYGLYKCICGAEFKCVTQNIKNGNTTSCGCYRKEHNPRSKHNLSKHKLMPVWGSIVQRCTNPKHKQYKDYGGRGIIICDEWRNDFKTFYDWSVNNGYEDGLSIDRIDNDKGYEQNNCRWANRQVQSRNKRKIQSNNKTGYKGVSFHKNNFKYQSNITVDNKVIYIGSFINSIDAAMAYDRYVIDNNLGHTRNFS